MMQRLLDQTSQDDVSVRSRALLASMPSIETLLPARPTAVAMLMRPRRAAARPLSLVFASLFLLVGVGIAAAAATSTRRLGSLQVGDGSSRQALRMAVKFSQALPKSTPAVAPDSPTAKTALVSSATPPSSSAASNALDHPAGHPAAARPDPAESELVLRAVRALRRDDDPALAGTLAEECLRRFPSGSQAEEALVIAMQAAEARGSRSAAERYARRYVARYPSGRFAAQARSIVARTGGAGGG